MRISFHPIKFNISLAILFFLFTLAGCLSGSSDSSDNGTPTANTAPVVQITSPSKDAIFSYGDTVSYSATATDNEDGELSGTSLVWVSSIDGRIGSGKSLSLDKLSVGAHTITLTGTDSSGATSFDTINITINETDDHGTPTANTAPVVQITSPSKDAMFSYGDTVSYSATATDNEDGELSGTSLIWVSSIDGRMGTGKSLSLDKLSVGAHTITLTGTDSSGATSFDTINITINETEESVMATIYEALPNMSNPDDFIEQANTEGADGYQYIGPYVFGDDNTTIYALYAKSSQDDTCSYKLLSKVSDAKDFIEQANLEGENGYKYLGHYIFGDDYTTIYTLYGKSSQDDKYSYKLLGDTSNADNFIEQANKEGADGYQYIGSIVFGDVYTVYALYGKSSQDDKYSYKLLGDTSNADDFIEQANKEGADGYHYMGPYVFGDDYTTTYNRYGKSSQNDKYSYKLLEDTSNADDFIKQANTEGADGYQYIGHYIFGDDYTVYTLYVLTMK